MSWKSEPTRHSLARKGIKTGRKQSGKTMKVFNTQSRKDERIVFVKMATGEKQGYVFPNQKKADAFVKDLSDKKRYPNIEVIKQVG